MNTLTQPSQYPETDVVIVGAGPTGLTLACELLRRGVRCVVLDRRAAPSAQQKALIVWSGALEALDALGAADEVVAAGIPLRAASYWSGARRIGRVGFGGLRDTRFAGPVCLPQPGVEAALRTRLAELGGHIRYGTELVGLDAAAPDSVTAELATFDSVTGDSVTGDSGTAGPAAGVRAHRVTASWLVGCDGAHSRVRDLIGVPFDGDSYQETFMLADGLLPGGPADEARYHLVPGGVCVLVPLPGGAHRVFVSDTSDAPLSSDISEAEVTAAVNRLLDQRVPGGLRLTDPLWASRFRVHRKLASSYRVGRCLLAGDAAHVHSPAGGQGMNTGIQDAANLGWKLAAAVHRPETAWLLDSYQDERKPVATRVSALSDQQTRTWFMSKPLARAVRNVVMRGLSRSGLLEKRMVPAIAQLDLNYTGSLAVRDESQPQPQEARKSAAGATVVPGRRMPRVWLSAGDGGEVSVSDLLRDPRFHVVIVPDAAQGSGTSAPDLARLVESAFDDRAVAVVDSPHGALARLLAGRVPGSTVLLVRPDGYLAARLDAAEPQALTDALTRHLGFAGPVPSRPPHEDLALGAAV